MIEKDQYALRHVNRWIVRGGIVHGTQFAKKLGHGVCGL